MKNLCQASCDIQNNALVCKMALVPLGTWNKLLLRTQNVAKLVSVIVRTLLVP